MTMKMLIPRQSLAKEKKIHQRAARAVLIVIALAGLVACGESDEELDEEYNEGYNDGQYEVCKEIEGIAPGLKDQLRHCQGF